MIVIVFLPYLMNKFNFYSKNSILHKLKAKKIKFSLKCHSFIFNEHLKKNYMIEIFLLGWN